MYEDKDEEFKCCGVYLEMFGVTGDDKWKYYCRKCSTIYCRKEKRLELMIDYTKKKKYQKYSV